MKTTAVATPGPRVGPAARRPACQLALLGAAALAAAGCAAPPPVGNKAPPYVTPVGVPTARLVMRSANLPATDVYGVYVLDDAANCKGARIAGAGNATRNPTTVALAAGSLATVDFVLVKGAKSDKPLSCVLRWSFTPQAGKSYLLQGSGTPTGCTVRVLDASNPDAMQAVPGMARRNQPGNACVPMAQAVAAGNRSGGNADGVAELRPAATTDDLQGLIGK